MKRIRQFIGTHAESVDPFLLLFVCFVAFGLFIPFLGFYWDDWPTIFYTYNHRFSQLVNHFSYDRPFSIWAYWLVGQFGTSPIIWQVAALLLNWATALGLVWALTPLWPGHNKKILYIALLFAVYPGYYVQPSSVIFTPHLAALALFLLSLGAMGRAILKPNWGYTLLGLGAAVAHMFTVEYFVGLELIRPLYIWVLLSNNRSKTKPTVKETGRLWAPFAAIFTAWVVWRLFLLKLPSEPYPLVLISELRSDPISALGHFLLTIVLDLQYTFVQVWANLLQPMLASLSTRFGIANLFVCITAAGIVFFVLSNLSARAAKTKARQADVVLARQGLALGLAAFVLGMFPIWAIGETIIQGEYNLRYILVGMMGSALVVGSILIFFVPARIHRILLVSLLVAVALGSHIQNAEDYRRDWQAQRNFYWQLFWRAPSIQTNTALVSFDRISTYLGDPMTGNALNILYPSAGDAPSVGLWNFELNRSLTVNSIAASEPLENDYRGLTFSAEAGDAVVFYYLPADGCLWMLSPLNSANDYLPFENRELVAHSNLERVVEKNNGYSPPTHIFGSEPARSWCYYFEKADLAGQQGKWTTVIELMQEAQQLELEPNYGIEWLPLVEAYAEEGQLNEATELSQHIHGMHSRNDGMLCATWNALEVRINSEEVARSANQIRQLVSCESN